jgi:leucyl aminopeptidase
MDFNTLVPGRAGLAGIDADALLVIVVGTKTPAELDGPLAAALGEAVKGGDFAFKAAQVLYAHRVSGVKAPRVAFVWAADAGAKAMRRAVTAGVALVKSGGAAHLAVTLAGAPLTDAAAEALVLAAHDATYVYRATKPSAPAAAKLARLSLVAAHAAEEKPLAAGLARGRAVAAGVALARECANRPANHCTPSYLAEQAVKLGKSRGLKVEVLERRDCERLGMGSFLAVAQGSEQPPKFIVMRWQGAGKGAAPLVLVGKGITFDTGGISIKPAAEMDEMKFDMGGAASVLGTLRAVAELEGAHQRRRPDPGVREHAERPRREAGRRRHQPVGPDDRDPEHRRRRPADPVRRADLRRALRAGRGRRHRHADRRLRHRARPPSQRAFQRRRRTGRRVAGCRGRRSTPAWRMPLDEEYDEALKSNFADMANVGPRAGGAITAAMFLRRFTAKLRWAHLDIAGTAWRSGTNKGSTGRPVPLLTPVKATKPAKAARRATRANKG